MKPTLANEIIWALADAPAGGNTLPFATKYMRDGDSVGEAWVACTNGDALCALLRHTEFRFHTIVTDYDLCRECKRRCELARNMFCRIPRREFEVWQRSRSTTCPMCAEVARELVAEPSFAFFATRHP